MDDGSDVFGGPRDRERAAADEHEDHRFPRGDDGFQKLLLSAGQAQRRPIACSVGVGGVALLALELRRKAEDEDRDVRSLGRGDGLEQVPLVPPIVFVDFPGRILRGDYWEISARAMGPSGRATILQRWPWLCMAPRIASFMSRLGVSPAAQMSSSSTVLLKRITS